MAGKYIELPEAASLLGMSEDELKAKCANGEVRGLRAGANLKFKVEDLQQFAEREGLPFGGGSGTDADQAAEDELISADLDDDFGSLMAESGFDTGDSASKSPAPPESASAKDEKDEDEQLRLEDEGDALTLEGDDELQLQDEAGEDDASSSILVSEEALGGGAEDSTSSTIIGAGGPPDLLDESEESDLKLTDDDSVISGGSELNLADEASGLHGSSGGSDVLGDDSELKLASGSGTGELSDALADEIEDLDLGSDVDLALSEDDDLVLGASSAGDGSDVTLDTEGSGINLGAPADSGLSLEDEPLELGGSDIGSSLELPEDDDFISLDNAADPDEATQLKQDEEFLLSPSDDLEVEGEDSDSGSQVIALEDSEAFDEDAATMLQPDEAALVADEGHPDMAAHAGGAAAMGAGAAAGMGAAQLPMQPVAGAPAAMMQPQAPAEAPYTIWQVLVLLVVVLLLSVTGMLMTDLIRNMWSWQGDYPATTSLMDSITSMLSLTN